MGVGEVGVGEQVPNPNQATEDMRMRREGNMNNELLRSSNLLLSHLYSHVLEE